MTETLQPPRQHRFIAYLQRHNPEQNPDANRKALAELRRSLSFPLGTHIPSFPYVERFLSENTGNRQRSCYYLVAGLYASHPLHTERDENFGRTMAHLSARRDSGSLEKRFSSLLAADELDQLAHHARQLISLLKAEGVPVNYARLLKDIDWWQHDNRFVQRKWAQSYYYGYDLAKDSTQTKGETL